MNLMSEMLAAGSERTEASTLECGATGAMPRKKGAAGEEAVEERRARALAVRRSMVCWPGCETGASRLRW